MNAPLEVLFSGELSSSGRTDSFILDTAHARTVVPKCRALDIHATILT